MEEQIKKPYRPSFLGWAKSYEQEKREMEELIKGRPADLSLLLREYEELTGEPYEEVQ
jgi:hypothetical protein